MYVVLRTTYLLFLSVRVRTTTHRLPVLAVIHLVHLVRRQLVMIRMALHYSSGRVG